MKKKAIKINNPQRNVLRRLFFLILFFSILGINSFLNFDINSFDGMFIMVSFLVVLTSLFFVKTTIKNVKALDEAILNRKMLVHWKYTKTEWLNFLNEEEKVRMDNGKGIAIILSFITALVFIPFILIIPDGKLAMFFVMLALFIMYAFMAFVFPMIVFYFRKHRFGEVILMEKGILLGKQFHTWDFPLSKFNNAKYLKKPYEHLQVVYDFVDRTGPRSYAINVPIPKNNKKEIKNIIAKFK